MNSFLHFIFLLSLLSMMSCAVKRESHRQTAERHSAVSHVEQTDSLLCRQWLQRTAGQQVEWTETVFSAPDSAGRQHVEKVRQAVVSSLSHEEEVSSLRSHRKESRAEASASVIRTDTKKKSTTLPPVSLALTGMIMIGIILCYLREK